MDKVNANVPMSLSYYCIKQEKKEGFVSWDGKQ